MTGIMMPCCRWCWWCDSIAWHVDLLWGACHGACHGAFAGYERSPRIVAVWTREDVKGWLAQNRVADAVVNKLYGRGVDGLQLMSLFFMHRRGDWSWWSGVSSLWGTEAAAEQVTRACEKLESTSWVVSEDVCEGDGGATLPMGGSACLLHSSGVPTLVLWLVVCVFAFLNACRWLPGESLRLRAQASLRAGCGAPLQNDIRYHD